MGSWTQQGVNRLRSWVALCDIWMKTTQPTLCHHTCTEYSAFIAFHAFIRNAIFQILYVLQDAMGWHCMEGKHAEFPIDLLCIRQLGPKSLARMFRQCLWIDIFVTYCIWQVLIFSHSDIIMGSVLIWCWCWQPCTPVCTVQQHLVQKRYRMPCVWEGFGGKKCIIPTSLVCN